MAGTPRPQVEHGLGPGIALTPESYHYLANRSCRLNVHGRSRNTTSDRDALRAVVIPRPARAEMPVGCSQQLAVTLCTR